MFVLRDVSERFFLRFWEMKLFVCRIFATCF